MKKLTYVDALNAAIELTEGEVREKLIALRDATAKRNAADRKPTKTQQANEGIKSEILDFLADGGKYTVTARSSVRKSSARLTSTLRKPTARGQKCPLFFR